MSGFLSSVQSTGETRLAISPERYTRIDNSSDIGYGHKQKEKKKKYNYKYEVPRVGYR
jgi:hypothetical protein